LKSFISYFYNFYNLFIGRKVWQESSWKLCWFHIKMNATEKLDSLHLPAKLRTFFLHVLDNMHQKTTVQEAETLWKVTKEEISDWFQKSEKGNEDLLKYIQTW
jgi:transposase-like protein